MTESLLPNPGLENDDPRQLLYGLFEAVGLSIIVRGPGPVEPLVEAALAAAPSLARSHHLGRGFMRLDDDPETSWVAVEGPHGSALIVMLTPESNSSLAFERIVQPTDKLRAPYSREMATRGKGAADVIELIAAADVVPLQEVAAFPQLRDEPYAVLPVWVRRAAASWERLSHDLYKVTLSEPETTDVFVGLFGGRVVMMTPVGEGSAPDWLAPLLEGGDHWVEFLDPMVALATVVAGPLDASALEARARQLVTDVSAAFTQAATDALPDAAPITGTPWERISSLPPGARPSRPWQPETAGDYTFIEHVRECVDGDTPFDLLEQLANDLRRQRSTGFEYAWRGEGDALLSPTWATFRSVVADPASGRVLAAGHPTHQVWDVSPVHDLGVIDGRNMSTFPEAGHPEGLIYPADNLYIGSLHTGVLVPLDGAISVISVDLHAPTSTGALLQHLGSSTCAAVIVEPSGERRVLTVLEGMSGDEPIRFSGDGAWLLISRTRDSVLVEVASGRWVTIGLGNATWWPLGESALLTISHEQEGIAYPALFSLTTNTFDRAFPAIELDVPLLETYPHVWRPTVSPDGTEVLALSGVGVSVEYQSKNGTGSRVVRFDLETGRGRVEHTAFLDAAESLERNAREVRWSAAHLADTPVVLHPGFEAALNDPVTDHPGLAVDKWEGDAEVMIVKCVNRALDLTGEEASIAHLVPEILAALVVAAQVPAMWARRAEWLTGLRQVLTREIVAGSLPDHLAASWGLIAGAISAAEAGRPDLIDPVGSGWVA